MKTKSSLYCTLTAVFVGCLLISNIMAAKTFMLGNLVLPTAVIIFPISYICNDVIAEIYGFKKAKRIIYSGFLINVLAVIAYNIAIHLPAPDFATDVADAFAIVLGSTARTLIASFSAYLVGSITNAKIMELMKVKSGNSLMLRCIVSTLVGEGLDAFIFISIAFYGTMPINQLVIMILAQAAFKTLYEVVVYPLTKVVIGYIRKLPEE